MNITLELANILSSIYILCLLGILSIYLFLRNKPLIILTSLTLVIDVFIRVAGRLLISMPNVKVAWYLTFMTVSLVAVYYILKTVRNYPHIQSVGLPIAFFWFCSICIGFLRYSDRNIFESNYFKTLYSVGNNALSYMILIYLFAPIGILLVKSIRGRISAMH